MKKNSLLQTIGRLPGMLKFATMIYCGLDKETPLLPRALALFALFYLVFPIDLIPDVLFVLLGLGIADDLALLYMTYKTMEQYIQPKHVDQARAFFQLDEAAE